MDLVAREARQVLVDDEGNASDGGQWAVMGPGRLTQQSVVHLRADTDLYWLGSPDPSGDREDVSSDIGLGPVSHSQ